MSSIWHTTDEAPKPWVSIAFYVDGYLYDGYYEPQFNQYGIFGADKVEKWCYVKELSLYIPSLETELNRTRKALEIAVDTLNTVTATPLNSRVIHDTANKALDKITVLEQKDEK